MVVGLFLCLYAKFFLHIPFIIANGNALTQDEAFFRSSRVDIVAGYVITRDRPTCLL